MHPSSTVFWSDWVPGLSRDGRLLFGTGAVRNFAYGFLSVVLGLYLAALGMDTSTICGLFTAALVGGAVMTLLLTAVADRLGRRRVLLLGAVLMALAGATFAMSDNVAVLFVAAIVGTISPSGKEVGPFLSVEQAILPQTTRPEERTSAFASYNLVTTLAAAFGALAAGLPTLLHLEDLDGYRLLVWGYAAAAVVLFFLFLGLSPRVEATRVRAAGSRGLFRIQRSRGVVARLGGLFALDAFAGGFIVQGLIAYWFFLRYDLDLATLGAIFFGTNLLAALSFLAAVPLARRFGLLNTMVFSHLPSNVMLLLMPFMPNVYFAVGLLLVRNLLSQLDIPTRQSYTMAIVDESERAGAAGILSVSRNGAMAVAPLFAGLTLAIPALALPFVVAGSLKIVYDLAIFSVFRKVRPPEEARLVARSRPAESDPS